MADEGFIKMKLAVRKKGLTNTFSQALDLRHICLMSCDYLIFLK